MVIKRLCNILEGNITYINIFNFEKFLIIICKKKKRYSKLMIFPNTLSGSLSFCFYLAFVEKLSTKLIFFEARIKLNYF